MKSAISIRKLAHSDIDATAILLADAFADNPCYLFMHPRVTTRTRDLRAFFRRNLLWHLEPDLTWVAADDHGKLVGTVTLEPPGGVIGTPLSLMTTWVVPTLWQQGLTTVRRIAQTDSEFKQRYLEDTLGLPYWHMHAAAIANEFQGQGLGSRMLKHVLRELDVLLKTRPGPVVLSTQRERNVPFYRRLGFELTGTLQMGTSVDATGYQSWFFRHPQPGRHKTTANGDIAERR